MPTLQRLIDRIQNATKDELEIITQKLDSLRILHAIAKRVQNINLITKINNLKLYKAIQNMAII